MEANDNATEEIQLEFDNETYNKIAEKAKAEGMTFEYYCQKVLHDAAKNGLLEKFADELMVKRIDEKIEELDKQIAFWLYPDYQMDYRDAPLREYVAGKLRDAKEGLADLRKRFASKQ